LRKETILSNFKIQIKKRQKKSVSRKNTGRMFFTKEGKRETKLFGDKKGLCK
jgi:hypothetical protein